jgi:3-mercaptopyruvate sulfurtransferase SseA
MIACLEDVRTRVGDPETQIVNALWEDWFDGCTAPFGNGRRGHIPGSINLPVERFLLSEDSPRIPGFHFEGLPIPGREGEAADR